MTDPLLISREDGQSLNTDIVSIPHGTAGEAGAFTDVVLRTGVAGETADYICSSHANMGAAVTVAAGAAGIGLQTYKYFKDED